MPKKKEVKVEVKAVEEKVLVRCATCGKLLPEGFIMVGLKKFCSPGCVR